MACTMKRTTTKVLCLKSRILIVVPMPFIRIMAMLTARTRSHLDRNLIRTDDHHCSLFNEGGRKRSGKTRGLQAFWCFIHKFYGKTCSTLFLLPIPCTCLYHVQKFVKMVEFDLPLTLYNGRFSSHLPITD